MKIIINDANILIDLIRLELMQEFTNLKLELKTTDFVFEELYPDQRKSIQKLIETGKIDIIKTESEDDYNGIMKIVEKTSGLSFEDCSVWYYANKLNGILLSGDGKLRKQALANGISVKGILYVFDQLLLNEIITAEYAIEKIIQLNNSNSRLPKEAINERIAKWSVNLPSFN